jgi:predicted DNA-binding transcriptional regulator AlpA
MTSVSQQSELLTVRQVAELLQVPVSWVYGRMRKRSLEQLPAYRLGKYWRNAPWAQRSVLPDHVLSPACYPNFDALASSRQHVPFKLKVVVIRAA